MKNYKQIMQMQFDLLKDMYIDEYEQKQGYSAYWSNVICDNFWNFATDITYEDLCKADLLEKIEKEFEIRDRVPCIYLPTNVDDYKLTQRHLQEKNYQVKDRDAFMLYKGNKLDVSVEAEVREVGNIDELTDFLKVMNDAFGGESTAENPYGGAVDETYTVALKKSLNNKESKFHHLVLYKDGEPVSVATLIYKNGCGGFYNVGTKKRV